MGYTTTFTGSIKLSRPLTLAEAKELLEFNDDPDTIPQPKPGDGYMQWVPAESLEAIVWDGNEKFYDYTPWLRWMCDWLQKRGIGACGQLLWRGEDRSDAGEILVVDNVVSDRKGKVVKSPKPLTLHALGLMAIDNIMATTASN